MQIITDLKTFSIHDELAIALGTFDGVHIGHLQILDDAIREAKENNCKSACFTFSNHPLNYIKKLNYGDEGSVKLLCSEEQKLKILSNLGFDYVFNLPFDESTMTMRATDFVEDILYSKLNARIVCCGFNYTFGLRAEGNVDTLKEAGEKLCIKVNAHDAVTYEDETVSSTIVRSLVKEGNFELANKYLGRYYSISGNVVHGNKIGSNLGFPTMNLCIPPELEMPPNGVYFSRTLVDGKEYKSITNIGCRPTVGNNDKYLETHLFDFSSQAYGDCITVQLLKHHRPEIKFDSIELLSKQIFNDCELAKKY